MSKRRSFYTLMLATIIALSGFGHAWTASATVPVQQDTDPAIYQVTLTNLTDGQPFSPPVAVTHSTDVRMFDVGGQASDGLAAIAQAGDPAPMVELLNGIDDGVTDVINVGRPLTPSGTTATVEGNEITDSTTFTITAAPGDFLSLATMLICTNDGFVGLDSAVLPEAGEETTIALGGYDAGREENTEVSADLVDPCSALGPVGLDGDPNGNVDADVATDPADAIAEHPGISGDADLSVETHGWVEVATVTIIQMEESMMDDNMMGEADSSLITVPSLNNFDATVSTLQNALEAQGLTVFGVIDHAANAAGADLELLPTTLILVGNPNLGTPLMQSSRSVAIDLPQKFLVWEDENSAVFITYNAPQYLANRHTIGDQDDVLETIASALNNFANTAATELLPVIYEVTLENLAAGQPFSPPVAVTHSDAVRMFDVGGQASDELAAIAQVGDPMPMVELLNGIDEGVTDIVNVGRPLTPSGATATVEGNEITDSTTFTITAIPGDFLSLATMLICTNDGFTGLDSAVLPEEGEIVFELNGYDAGREENTEVSDDIVDPCTALGPMALDNDPNGNVDDDVATDPADVITEHAGIDGNADLSVEDHGWTDPVARLTISRLEDTSMMESEMMEEAMTPSVTVDDQSIEEGTVTVSEAVSNGPGWIAIHTAVDGAPGPVIGHSDLLIDGLNSNIVIEIDADAATETLYAMLHIDTGEAGIYEFPGPDGPVQVNGEVVTPAFAVSDS